MFKKNISVEDKIYAVKLYQDGKESQHRIASMFDVSWLLFSNGFVIMNLWAQTHSHERSVRNIPKN